MALSRAKSLLKFIGLTTAMLFSLTSLDAHSETYPASREYRTSRWTTSTATSNAGFYLSTTTYPSFATASQAAWNAWQVPSFWPNTIKLDWFASKVTPFYCQAREEPAFVNTVDWVEVWSSISDMGGANPGCTFTWSYVVINMTCPYGGILNVNQCINVPPCPPPGQRDPVTGACKKDQYTLSLTPDKATIEPGQGYTFTATVTNQDGSPPSQAVPVAVKVEVDPTSGGHDHGETFANRNKGSISPTNGTTSFPITFTATEVSGTHTITATCDMCTNKTAAATVYVKVDGLWPIFAAPKLYAFVGGELDKPHHDNHYLTSNAFNQLTAIAINYRFRYPSDPVLHLNDASLKWGGKFDIKGNWKGDHQGHKKGTVIDIRSNSINEKTSTNPGSSIPERLFAEFETLVNGTRKTLPNGEVHAKAKLHCSVGRDPAIDNCVGDINRHYHVILLGVDQ
jgi:hypothetical protein